MPTTTERQQANLALEQAYVLSLMAEAEAEVLQMGYDSGSDYPDSDSSKSSSSSDETSSGSSTSSSSDDGAHYSSAEAMLHLMGELNSERYLNERRPIAKTDGLLRLLLDDWKVNHPKIFRSYLRITPSCFDELVDVIRDHPVCHNDSNNAETPVEEQLAVALYRFGHFGNAASTQKVGLQFGFGYGTVRLFTCRVMAATCSEQFRRSTLRWSSPAAKETAKQWVADQSCPAWRDGWLMVDGTLVPLFQRPGFHGTTFFDRKSNYSLNIQVSTTLLARLYN